MGENMAQRAKISHSFTDETFAMVFLAVATFGVYNLIWSARAVRYVNGLAKTRIIADWPIAVGASVAGIQGYLITIGVESDDIGFLLLMYDLSGFLNLIFVAMLITLAFMFRSALLKSFGTIGVRRKLNPVWTFLFGVIYINHVMQHVATNTSASEKTND